MQRRKSYLPSRDSKAFELTEDDGQLPNKLTIHTERGSISPIIYRKVKVGFHFHFSKNPRKLYHQMYHLTALYGQWGFLSYHFLMVTFTINKMVIVTILIIMQK